MASGTLPRSVCGILCGQQKSAKSYSFKKLQKAKENTRNSKISGVVLELLTRFELLILTNRRRAFQPMLYKALRRFFVQKG